MNDLGLSAVEEIVKENQIPFCIYVNTEGQNFEVEMKGLLKDPNFPDTLYFDETSTKDNLDYLEFSKQPRILSQGLVRTVMGTVGKRQFAYFLNANSSVLEYYELAKRIYSETVARGKSKIQQKKYIALRAGH